MLEATRERIRAKKRQEMAVFDFDGFENSELWSAYPIVREPATPKAAAAPKKTAIELKKSMEPKAKSICKFFRAEGEEELHILDVLTIARLVEVQPYVCGCNFTPPRICHCGLSHGKGALRLSIMRAPYP